MRDAFVQLGAMFALFFGAAFTWWMWWQDPARPLPVRVAFALGGFALSSCVGAAFAAFGLGALYGLLWLIMYGVPT